MSDSTTWTYLPHWESGMARRIGACALSALLVLGNHCCGLTPARAAAEEGDACYEAELSEAEEASRAAPVEVVEETASAEAGPGIPDASDDVGHTVVVADEAADAGALEGARESNAPPAEDALPEVPATVEAVYAITAGMETETVRAQAVVTAHDGFNRITLAAHGGEVSVGITLDGADITSKAAVADDMSYVDVPSEIDLAKVSVAVSVTVADVDDEITADTERADEREAQEELGGTSADKAETDSWDENAEGGSTDGPADEAEYDMEAYNLQMAELESYIEEEGLEEAERQVFMMRVGMPLLAAAAQTGKVTSVKSTGLGDGITADHSWTIDGKAAYCISSYLESPTVGTTFTRYSGNLGIKELDYVLYHGYDGVTVPSVGGLNEQRSIAATQAAVWYVVGTKRQDVLNINGIFSNDNYYNRLYGLNVISGRQDIYKAAKALVDAAAAYASAGGGGAEDGYAQIYLNPGKTIGGVYYQHMAAVGEKSGTIELVKSSTDPDLVAVNDAYSLEGAVYGVYSSKADANADANRVATLTTDADGKASATLAAGTYYVKEVSASAGHALDGMVYTATVSTGATATVASTEDTITNDVSVKKASAYPELTASLPGCYSLAGAEYEVRDSAGTLVGTLVTDEDGSTEALTGLPIGTYTVKETKAPKGFLLDESTYTKELAGGESWTVESADMPGNDPARMTVKKLDKDTGEAYAAGKAELAGAEFTVRYYGNTDGDHSDMPVRTWVLRTNEYGVARLMPADIVDGSDELYMFGATYGLPVGTVTVQETKAPTGYEVDDTLHTFVIDVDSDMTSVNALNGGEDIYIQEQVLRGDVRWIKTDSDGNRMAGVSFKITSHTTGESVIVTTDANGIFDSSRRADKAAAWMPQDTEADYRLGAFPYDTYDVEEIRTAGVNSDMVLCKPFSFTVDGDTAGITQNLGTYVNKPVRIQTTLTEKTSGAHYAPGVGSVTLIDTISYENLDTDASYWFEGELMDKETNESTGITATGTAFKPALSSSTATMAYTADASALAGKALVCFEELHQVDDDGFVVVHKDIDDECQTVYFPSIGTTLVGEDGSHEVLAEAPITLTDTVAYENLEPGIEHTVTGELMDKESGEATGITATAAFTPTASSGTVDVTFTFDGFEWMRHSLVAFETVTRGGRTWAVHADIDDVDQTVRIVPPEIGTTLADEEGEKEILAEAPIALVDTVSYENLKPGKAYTVTGELMDKATGEGLGITATATFTPTAKDGTAEVTFTIDDASLVIGKHVVAFETVSQDGRQVAVHADIDDVEQTVSFPKIGTALVDADGEHESAVTDEAITLTDIVSYEALTPGKTYTMHAELVDKATGAALASAGTEFTPEESDGTVEVSIEVPRADVLGKVTVCFETLVREGREVAIHADIEDEGQTVNFPDAGTTLIGSEGEKAVLAEKSVTLTDTVAYKGLVPGKTYSVAGTLVDKATGEEIGATAGASFVPEAPDGTVEVTFEIEGYTWMGHELVAFETVSRDGRDIVIHADIDDEGQTVEIPEIEIGTTLADAEGNHEVLSDGSIALVDTVEYKDLKPGKEYTVTGELMDKSTGEGLGITGESVFTPEAKDGTVEVAFTIEDGETVEGKTLVAFEELLFEETVIAEHKDIDDVDQTVTVPKIGTTLTDEAGEKTPASAGPIVLVDTVAYENLIPGKPYTVTGELVDKATGEALGIFASVPLVPEEADGEVEVAFRIEDASFLAGRTAVAFETVKQDGREVAIHADLEDGAQTLEFPKIQTTATGDGGTKRVLAGGTVKVTDAVAYENLMPGLTYTMRGEIHFKNADGTDGGVLLVGGKPVEASATFTPEAATGTVEMAFAFDSAALAGHSLVVFECCYEVHEDGAEELIAEHADIADEGQTVEVYALPKTGDATDLGMAGWLAVAGASIAVTGACIAVRRRAEAV